MKKMLALILMMSLMTVSCEKSGGGSSTEEVSSTVVSNDNADNSNSDDDTNADSDNSSQDDETPAPAPVPSVPALALSFQANVDYMNLTATQEDKYNEAVALVKKVIATEAFKKKVLNHLYNGSKQFANNNGKTNAQIYQSILDAAESLKPAKNNTMDIGVKFYYENNSVVGYTNPSITYINVNTKYFNSYEANEVAGNLFHEWLHKLGYGHDYSATAKRPYSVPYGVGYIIRELGKNFL